MRKNNCLRAAALLLACCLFGLCTATGTLARYVTVLPGTGQKLVRAGIFDVKVQTSAGWKTIGSGELGSGVTIDLFQTLYEEDLITAEDSDDVVQSPKVIAPGTGGEFQIKVRNDSEVEVKVTVEVDDGNIDTNGIPLYWVDGASMVPNFPSGASAPTTDLGIGDDSTFTFQWVWDFDHSNDTPLDDASDTDLGISMPSYELPLKVIAEQKLPY